MFVLSICCWHHKFNVRVSNLTFLKVIAKACMSMWMHVALKVLRYHFFVKVASTGVDLSSTSCPKSRQMDMDVGVVKEYSSADKPPQAPDVFEPALKKDCSLQRLSKMRQELCVLNVYWIIFKLLGKQMVVDGLHVRIYLGHRFSCLVLQLDATFWKRTVAPFVPWHVETEWMWVDCFDTFDTSFGSDLFVVLFVLPIFRQVVERKPRCRSIANFPGYEPSRDVYESQPVSSTCFDLFQVLPVLPRSQSCCQKLLEIQLDAGTTSIIVRPRAAQRSLATLKFQQLRSSCPRRNVSTYREVARTSQKSRSSSVVPEKVGQAQPVVTPCHTLSHVEGAALRTSKEQVRKNLRTSRTRVISSHFLSHFKSQFAKSALSIHCEAYHGPTFLMSAAAQILWEWSLGDGTVP